MRKRFFIKLFCTVFALSFLVMACQPTKDDRNERKETMRRTQFRQSDDQPRQMMDGKDKSMPMKKQYDDGSCCPKDDCCPRTDCEWCKPRCDDTQGPQGIYAPREPMKKKCPECPPRDDCCEPCSSCGCDDCCSDCGCDDCCGSCGCDDCGCDDCCDPCDTCCPSGRKYTRDEIFGRDTDDRNENRNDPRRYSEK